MGTGRLLALQLLSLLADTGFRCGVRTPTTTGPTSLGYRTPAIRGIGPDGRVWERGNPRECERALGLSVRGVRAGLNNLLVVRFCIAEVEHLHDIPQLHRVFVYLYSPPGSKMTYKSLDFPMIS